MSKANNESSFEDRSYMVGIFFEEISASNIREQGAQVFNYESCVFIIYTLQDEHEFTSDWFGNNFLVVVYENF